MHNLRTRANVRNHHILPLFVWADDNQRRHYRPETAAGRTLARRGVPAHLADLYAELAGLCGGDGR